MFLKLSKGCIFFFAVLTFSCTKLDETFRGDLTEAQVAADSANTAALLEGVYSSLQFPFTSQLVVFPLQEISTDEAISPTRGPEWDDNGVWRVLHQQKWASNNERIRICFNTLNGISFAATDLLRFKPTPQEQAEARLIRAWVNYLLLDLFDQVPYRDPGESLVIPARVRKGIEALDYIIAEINAVEPDLPAINPVWRANRYAAKVLLMKCYLNKAVYKNRVDPAFDPADMNKIISLADNIINSNTFSFSEKYFDNFAPDNDVKSKENIFTLFDDGFATTDNYVAFIYSMVLHYNQPPPLGAGFNGWATLADFYDKFEVNDKRRGAVYEFPGSPPNPGNHINVGFLLGQQYSWQTGVPLTDRNGSPLIFTREVKNIELGANLESTGIRPLKYFPDPGWFDAHNDFVFFRFSDVLLMKAEAILRGGTGTIAGSYGSTTLAIVNAIRTDTSRGATALTSINKDILFDERGRELWWEGWRRQDMIRFDKFLKPFQEKNYQSDPKYLVYPIPDEQLAVNPNLKQNPGY
jgi:hypothetical protein